MISPMAAMRAAEADKYDRAWQVPNYRRVCWSLRLWRQHRGLFPEFETALDIGAGLGLWFGAMNDAGRDCWAIDLTENALDAVVAEAWGHKRIVANMIDKRAGEFAPGAPDRFDFGLCVDVMEHIPEPMLEGVLEAIAARCDEVLFLIANYPSHNDETGENLHPTLHDAAWWCEALAGVGGAVEYLRTEAIRLDRPKYLIRWRP